MKTLTLHHYYTPLGTFGYLHDDKGAEFKFMLEDGGRFKIKARLWGIPKV